MRSNDKEFSRYLLETRKYDDQNLPAIISDLSLSKAQTAFHIAAQNGDRKFFKILNEKARSDHGFCQKIKNLSREINWDSVIDCGNNYGNLEALPEIESCRRNLEIPRTSFSTFWSFIFPGNAVSILEKQLEGSIRQEITREKDDSKSPTR